MIPDAAPSACHRLLDAFLATEYRAEVNGRSFVLRIGRRHPTFDQAIGQRPWLSITACNPRGQRQSESANQAAMQALTAAIDGEGFQAWKAEHRATDGSPMDEPALLVLDAPSAWIHRQAHRFDQLAVVHGQPGQAAELWLYDDSAAEYQHPAIRRMPS